MFQNVVVIVLTTVPSSPYLRILLRLLCYHENELEVVGAEGHVEEDVDVHAVEDEPQGLVTQPR